MSLETFLEINLFEHLSWRALQRSALLLEGEGVLVWVSDLLISPELCPHTHGLQTVKSLMRGKGGGVILSG